MTPMTNRQALSVTLSNDAAFNEAVKRLRKRRAKLVKKMQGQPLNVKAWAYREFDDHPFTLKNHEHNRTN